MSWKDQSGGTNWYASIDEEVPNDTDYVWDENATVGDSFTVSLSNPAFTPDPSGAHILRWRASKISGVRTVTVKCELLQGSSTVIASNEQTLTSSYQTFSYTLTSGERSSITNYNDLRLRFTVTGIT